MYEYIVWGTGDFPAAFKAQQRHASLNYTTNQRFQLIKCHFNSIPAYRNAGNAVKQTSL